MLEQEDPHDFLISLIASLEDTLPGLESDFQFEVEVTRACGDGAEIKTKEVRRELILNHATSFLEVLHRFTLADSIEVRCKLCNHNEHTITRKIGSLPRNLVVVLHRAVVPPYKIMDRLDIPAVIDVTEICSM